MKTEDNLLTRRSFLAQGACAAVGSASLLSTMLNLRQVNAAASAGATDYKALICLFLYGGNDAANLLMPVDNENYSLYTVGRQNLAIPQNAILPLNVNDASGKSMGLHPSLGGVRQLFSQGDCALVSNVGTLLAPVTLQDFQNRSSALPPNLFSHNDQQALWQTSVPENAAAYEATGWGGRIADLLSSIYNDESVSMSISISGSNFFQVGKEVIPFRLSSNGSSGIAMSNSNNDGEKRKYQAFVDLLNLDHHNLMEETFADITKRAIDSDGVIASALEATGDYPNFPNSGLGQQMRTIAKLIEAREALGMRRQVFFCATGGFDTHGDQLGAHAGLLGGVNAALMSFDTAMRELGVHDQVTTFTASDFGRTFVSNGRGSDHGWGSHQIVMGGAVNGGAVYGAYPSLDPNASPDDVGRGRWIPKVSVDEYGATMARWFGVSSGDLPSVFPNIGNFGSSDLGFMG